MKESWLYTCVSKGLWKYFSAQSVIPIFGPWRDARRETVPGDLSGLWPLRGGDPGWPVSSIRYGPETQRDQERLPPRGFGLREVTSLLLASASLNLSDQGNAREREVTEWHEGLRSWACGRKTRGQRREGQRWPGNLVFKWRNGKAAYHAPFTPLHRRALLPTHLYTYIP